jgi:hypothetical protein
MPHRQGRMASGQGRTPSGQGHIHEIRGHIHQNPGHIHEIRGHIHPGPEFLAALLEGATEAELVALGQSIATPRLLTDDRRIFSTAYDVYTQATPEQKGHLRSFSLELLSYPQGARRRCAPGRLTINIVARSRPLTPEGRSSDDTRAE